MKNGWKIIASLVALGLILPTAYSQRSIGETSPLQSYAGLGTLLASQDNPQKSYYNQLFSEETLTVTKEMDGVLPGTLRTILLQAAGIRHNNPFTLVKINFDPSVKRIRVTKGNLPPVMEGLISIDCADRVILDGSLLETSYLGEGESVAGLTLSSSGNTVKGCQIVGFSGNGIVIAGNRNQIRENKIGSEAPKSASGAASPLATEDTLTNSGSGIFISDNASENAIESNQIAGNKGDGVAFSPQAGSGNRVVGNIFSENGKKGINGNDNTNRTSRPILKPIYREGDSYIIAGTLSDVSDLEIFLAGANGREGKMVIVPLFTNGRGDFSVSVKSKGFVPGETKIVALATAPGRNTSEFSDPGLIPAFEVKSPEPAPTLPVAPPPSPAPLENKEANSNLVSPHDSADLDDGKSNEAKPLNEKASSALSVGNVPVPSNTGIFSVPNAHAAANPEPSVPDPFLNATTLPPPGTPQITPPSSVKAGGAKSSESDSLRVESVTDVGGAP